MYTEGEKKSACSTFAWAVDKSLGRLKSQARREAEAVLQQLVVERPAAARLDEPGPQAPVTSDV